MARLKSPRGTCRLCGAVATKGAMPRHLASCLPRESGEATEDMIQLRVESPGLPAYWLDLEVKASAKLAALDVFLRSVWLECCGHLSAFTIGSVRYASEPDDWGTDPGEKTMKVRAGSAIGPRVDRFFYEYDFGSTTELSLRVMGHAKGGARREAVWLLARNDAPTWSCSSCDAPAVLVCSICIGEWTWFACLDHEESHDDCDEDGWLPVVNSPRMGVSGYGG